MKDFIDVTIESELFNNRKYIAKITEMIEKEYKLTNEFAHKVAFVLSQLKLGYKLNIYDTQETPVLQSNLCTVRFVPFQYNKLSDIVFLIRVESLFTDAIDKMVNVNLGEFINTLKEYESRDMSFDMDFKLSASVEEIETE